MNKNNYPLWLKVAMRLSLKWKHWIRSKALMLEFWSTKLVVNNDTELLMLIENREKPDFEEFDKILNDIRKTWKIHDSYIEDLAVRKELLEFKQKHRKDKENISKAYTCLSCGRHTCDRQPEDFDPENCLSWIPKEEKGDWIILFTNGTFTKYFNITLSEARNYAGSKWNYNIIPYNPIY